MMTTTDRAPRVRRGLVPALLASMLLLSGCGEEESAAADAGDQSTKTTTALAGTTTTADVEPMAFAEDRGEPDIALATALEGLGDAYSFDSTVTTSAGDQVVIRGHRIAESMTYQIQSGDASVQIVTIGADSWIEEDRSGEWLESSESVGVNPLEVLSSPLAVTWIGSSANGIEATYDASALDLAPDGSVALAVTIDGDEVTFQTIQNGTSVSTTLVRTTDLVPIAAPVP
jgi:hypothetical protein